MARCLVTGGCGFIGSHIVRGLLDAGHKVRVLDNLSTGKRENLDEEGEGFTFLITMEIFITCNVFLCSGE